MTEPVSAEEIVIINIATKNFTLNATHRCDQCGHRAYLQVWLKETREEQETHPRPKELLFCQHHWHVNQAALWGRYMYLNDESQQLRAGIEDDHWVEGQVQSLPPRKKQPWEK